MSQWQPSAKIDFLKKRAVILQQIRTFFAQRNVLEVETPVLAKHGVTDVYLENITARFVGPGFANGLELYLQTSPEFAMKRLLAAGSGCIYQICKAFRDDESGRYHNPEFTMLEWYRIKFDAIKLMNEIDTLLQTILKCPPAQVLTYQQAFLQHLNFDPIAGNYQDLKQRLEQLSRSDLHQLTDDYQILLQLAFSELIEPRIGQSEPCFIYQFPAAQASLAKLNQDNPKVAERFELYYKNMELANGFHELTSANEQLKRFQHDNEIRVKQGKVNKSIDEKFIAALQAGLPDCSGVALGLTDL